MNKTIFGSLRTAIRTVIATSRYMAKKQEVLKSDEHLPIGSLSIISDGSQATVGGYGELYDNFIKTKQLLGYPGEKGDFTEFDSPDYDSAPLRTMRFDETYADMPYKVTSRKFWKKCYYES